MTMQEVFLLIEKQRELRYEEHRFLAAMQGHDLGPRWTFNEKNPDIMTDDSGYFGINVA